MNPQGESAKASHMRELPRLFPGPRLAASGRAGNQTTDCTDNTDKTEPVNSWGTERAPLSVAFPFPVGLSLPDAFIGVIRVIRGVPSASFCEDSTSLHFIVCRTSV